MTATFLPGYLELLGWTTLRLKKPRRRLTKTSTSAQLSLLVGSDCKVVWFLNTRNARSDTETQKKL
jgi:hypothetical protein